MSDRPRTLALFAEWTADRYGGRPALRFPAPDGGGWTDVGYEELRGTVRAVGRALLTLDVRPGDRVAVLARTRPEWTYVQLAALAAGAVVVPVYPTAGDEELGWVLSDSGASVAVVEDAVQAGRIGGLRERLPELRHVVRMDLPAGTDPTASLGELLRRAGQVSPSDLCGIIYTSGTTGLPKGCRLTHANLAAAHDATADLIRYEPGDSTYLYLPLAHLLAQLVQFGALLRGATLCYHGGRNEDIVAGLAATRPTHLPSVPRLFEKVHGMALALADAEGPDGRARLTAAVRTGVAVAALRERGEEPDGPLRAAWEAAEERVFAPVREVFGGRLRWALTGAAPIAPDTLDFLRACGVLVHEGYGMTETAGVVSLNRPGAYRPGTVGRPVPGCEVRIAPDGEILVRGPGIFPGYHRDPAATAAVLDAEGWLRTGDLGALDADGFLTVTGRKKDLVITSSGKNITPALPEAALRESRWISHAVLVGDRRPYPVALLTLDAAEIAGWAAREGVDLGPAGPERHPAVRRLCQEAVDAANARSAGPARIRAFAVLPGDFTVESGELTPTLKLRRSVILERYAKEIDSLYEALYEQRMDVRS
ncbi:AMP-dependent synthetase/ligase [Streptomyces huiliensis]|uniref:AMP-dependent synthetase/ligase n=1 Tax=Streptomyces huiliensis TaxID=2876027 RepID=UPI001CBE2C18|nr:AMP-dependent synthetase/ligase [Streptomyces huiliensis]MBZ4321129.1 AMP-dependent synthetase/ligase [Streptomyces huiliensis]